MATEHAQHWSQRAFEYAVDAVLNAMEARRASIRADQWFLVVELIQ
jgi:hypothetical protein